MMTDIEDKITDLFIIACIIVVIILKLTGAIQISWLWLTSIIWIPFLGGLVLAVGFLIIMLLENYINKIKEKK